MNAASYIISAILIATGVIAAYNLGRYHGARAAIEVFAETIMETEDELSDETEDTKDEKI